MESILSELSGLTAENLAAIPEGSEAGSDDSMRTQVDVRPPRFSINQQPSNQTEEIGVLVLMMCQLLACVSMAPVLSVHIVAGKCKVRLDVLTYLINTKGRVVTTEEVVKCLMLHQSIKGLIDACPHTFVVAQLEDYVQDTQKIIDSLYHRYKEHIVDDSSTKKSRRIATVRWPK